MGLAFGAGLVAALNPCGFAMLPAYLALVVRGENVGRRAAVGRAVTATAAMAVGFLTVFGGFGILTVSAASTVQRYLPYVTVLIGIILVALGIWLLAGREIRVLGGLARGARWAPTARLGSMFGYGISYAIASLSCTVGPFLAVTAAGTSQRLGPRRRGRLRRLYLRFHARGRGARGGRRIGQFGGRRPDAPNCAVCQPDQRRAAGGCRRLCRLLRAYEIRLFTGNGNPEDPVIAAAGRVQGAIAGWVHQHGAWPWLVALAVLTIAALAAAWRASASARYRRADRATAGDEP